MMRLRPLLHRQAGATIVEVLVAIALTGIFLPTLATALVAANAGKATTIQQLQAESLMREGTEAVRSVREKGWTNVATNGTYHPTISGGAWTLTSGSEVIGSLTRSIVISDTQRNTAGTIVASGGTVDPSTKHVVVTVSWTKPTTSSIASNAYLTRWQNNAVWTQSTQADFTGGTLINTCATAICDVHTPPTNSVQLADAPATWQLPSIIGSLNVTGNVSGLAVFEATISSVNYAFVGYSGGMAIVNVSNPAAPTLASTYTAQGQVNGIYVVGTVAYLATSSNTAELTTVNVANPAVPATDDTLNLGDTGDANTIYVVGGFAYVGKVASAVLNNEFYIANVATPTNITQSGTFTRENADINSICVNAAGTVAYLATSQANAQLRILNVSSKTNPTNDATVNLAVTANKIDCSNGTNIYVGTVNNGAAAEVRVYNVTTPTAPAAVGTGFEVGGDVNGLNIDPTNPNYLILATSVATKQMSIVNISTPSAITLVNNVSYGSVTNDVFVVGSYAYFGTANTAQELAILYTGYRPSGTFESSTFDPGANTGYNYITWNATVPANTTLKFQVAANNTNTGWSYVGPDGTAATFYTVGDSVPLNIISNRYFRYKATFTTTASTATPTLNDVEVNYSP